MSSALDHLPPGQRHAAAAPEGTPGTEAAVVAASVPGDGPADVAPAGRTRRGRRGMPPWVRRAVAFVLLVSCLGLVWMSLTERETLDTVVGNAKVAVHKHTDQPRVQLGAMVAGLPGGSGLGEWIIPNSMVRAPGFAGGGSAGDYLPQITLDGPGGERELDACTGGFTEMIEYQGRGPVLYAAHNTCEGDIILGWDIGQQFRVAGSDVLYQVIDERRAMPYADAEVLSQMPGDLVLQTCFYGEEQMRFLAVSPVQSA